MLDDALVPWSIYGNDEWNVSILVVLDDALVPIDAKNQTGHSKASLNPCCAGRCSSTLYTRNFKLACKCVSILVVLDDALVPYIKLHVKVG